MGNAEIVRRAYAAHAEQGTEALLRFIDPGFEVTTPPSLASEPDTYRGHDGIRRYLDSFSEAMDEISFEGREFTEAGDKVLVDTLVHARGRTTGIATEQRVFFVWTLRGGVATRAEVFGDRAQALEALEG